MWYFIGISGENNSDNNSTSSADEIKSIPEAKLWRISWLVVRSAACSVDGVGYNLIYHGFLLNFSIVRLVSAKINI